MQKVAKLHEEAVMNAQQIDRIITWLKTFPSFKKAFSVSKNTTGLLIDFTGTDEMERVLYMRSGERITYRNNYVIQIMQSFLDLSKRKKNADLLVELQQWVRQQSISGLVPLLGNHGRQTAYVDSQEYVDNEESNETGLYQVQLHIEYTVINY